MQLSFNIAWALRLVWKCGRGLACAGVCLVILNGAIPLAGLYTLKLVVDAIAKGLSGADGSAVFGDVAFLIALLGCIYILEDVLKKITTYVNTKQAEIVTDRMHDMLHSKSIEIDLAYYEDSNYYDTLYRAQEEAPYRPIRIVNNLLQLCQSGVSLIAIIGLLVSIHWSVPAFLVCAALPGLFVSFRFSAKYFSWQRQKTSSERQAGYFNWMLSRDSHAKEIRLFDLGGIFAERYRVLREEIRRERLQLIAKRSMAELSAELVPLVATFGLYIFLAHKAFQGVMTLGDLIMFFQAAQRARSYCNDCFKSVAGLYENNLFLSNVQEFLSLKPKIIDPAHPKPIPDPLQHGIVLENVSFQYPNSEHRVLSNVNLTIKPGEHIAFVGENGAGKTTLIKLLCRLYDPTAGSIRFDGIDLRDIGLKNLRKEISVVFQDYARYHQTARDNIWFGNIELPPDERLIAEAARLSGADEVIRKLGNGGYGTMLGKWFENGAELSIGEWQKIALARAFLRSSQIIVLDEPTSFMDPKSEYEVFERFNRLVSQKTAILVSHRLSTVKMVDRIYVLEHGKIAESGTHDELIRLSGKYAYLFDRQAQNYR
jgi:ATP-binding cassette subfamily B protein